MGNFLSSLIPCSKNKHNESKNKDNETKDSTAAQFNDTILDIDFFCPICGVSKSLEVPEILNFHSENGKIVFRCPKRDKEYPKELKGYQEKITGYIKTKCGNHENNENNENNGNNENNKEEKDINNCKKYCLECHKFLCQQCVRNEKINKEIIAKEISTNELNSCCNCFCCSQSSQEKKKEEGIHYIVDADNISVICPQHGLKTNIPCDDCQKNCCPKCFKDYHKWHKEGNINKTKINKARKIIEEKDKKLLKMKEFYEMVKSAAESNENIYKKNLKTVADCIAKENNRNKYETDLAIYKIKQEKQGIKQQNAK